ncbi:hypothetical protein T484DRAFT_1800025, partial [Baffinella frigidus]
VSAQREVRKPSFGGSEVSGALLHHLSEAYLDHCNAGSVPSVPAAFRRVSAARTHLAVQQAVGTYALNVTRIYPTLPVPESEVQGWHIGQHALAHQLLARAHLSDPGGEAPAALDR